MLLTLKCALISSLIIIPNYMYKTFIYLFLITERIKSNSNKNIIHTYI